MVMEQGVTGRRQIRALVRQTVRQIEEMTGIDSFHDLPDATEDEAETSTPDAEWQTNRMLVPRFDDRPRTIQTRGCEDN